MTGVCVLLLPSSGGGRRMRVVLLIEWWGQAYAGCSVDRGEDGERVPPPDDAATRLFSNFFFLDGRVSAGRLGGGRQGSRSKVRAARFEGANVEGGRAISAQVNRGRRTQGGRARPGFYRDRPWPGGKTKRSRGAGGRAVGRQAWW
ncbi:hypothetical protein OF83DRAFT_822949 [Amylostereum chailletii]|nr:hypothetical protein OF83DRAFT_822949 [Amylostereum chailletii]